MLFSTRDLCLFIVILGELFSIFICNVNNNIISFSFIYLVHAICVHGELELDATEVKFVQENKTIEANVTANGTSSNATKVNCLTHKVYGPVEVN